MCKYLRFPPPALPSPVAPSRSSFLFTTGGKPSSTPCLRSSVSPYARRTGRQRTTMTTIPWAPGLTDLPFLTFLFAHKVVFGGPALDAHDNLLKHGTIFLIRLEPLHLVPANQLYNRTGQERVPSPSSSHCPL